MFNTQYNIHEYLARTVYVISSTMHTYTTCILLSQLLIIRQQKYAPHERLHAINAGRIRSQTREALVFEMLLDRNFSFPSHSFHYLTDPPLHLTLSTRDTFFFT